MGLTNDRRFAWGQPDSLLAETRAKWLAENPEGWGAIKMDEEMAAEVKRRVKIYEALLALKTRPCESNSPHIFLKRSFAVLAANATIPAWIAPLWSC